MTPPQPPRQKYVQLHKVPVCPDAQLARKASHSQPSLPRSSPPGPLETAIQPRIPRQKCRHSCKRRPRRANCAAGTAFQSRAPPPSSQSTARNTSPHTQSTARTVRRAPAKGEPTRRRSNTSTASSVPPSSRPSGTWRCRCRRRRPPENDCRGRNVGYPTPPAQIRTWSLNHPAPTSGLDGKSAAPARLPGQIEALPSPGVGCTCVPGFLRQRGARQTLTMTVLQVLPSADEKTSALRIISFTMLNHPGHTHRYRRFA